MSTEIPSLTEGMVPEQAVAAPTKQFFVSMLTRDISLEDAILDLIDNCLDGALRIAKEDEVNYSKHFVDINFSNEQFSIVDNCGGIPRDTAKNYAFKMGRDSDDSRDSNHQTIGMYGIGMKRAIFKMGRDATVTAKCEQDSFEVLISSAWLNEKDWNPLPINQPNQSDEPLSEPGTRILVSSLYPSIAKLFQNTSFINDLRRAISQHFTLFLQRGLKIYINNELVEPVKVEIMISDRDDGPAPYVYQKKIDDVDVTITVGLNLVRPYSADDDEASEADNDRSPPTSGWTVFCNDRAVIVGDKTRLTGWGDGIPLYHGQFSVITGIIEFKSNQAEKLPVTTTKRALDTSSDVWLESYPKMKEGLRVWINYTNKWKNHPQSDQLPFWKDAHLRALSQVVEQVASRPNVTKLRGAIEFNPQKQPGGSFPQPKGDRPSSRRIVFTRPNEDIKFISNALFESSDIKPSQVGEACFDTILSAEKSKTEGES
jgi:hypothetical protein